MKSLADYIAEKILESQKESNEPASSKTFSFNFHNFENGKETIESVKKMADEKGIECEADESKMTLTVTREKCENHDIAGIQDVLQQYCEIIRKDSKNASDESHAQKTKSFEKKLDELVSYIDNVENYDPEEGEEE